MTRHQFHPTVLREYDVRGIVDETISIADARALGQAFGTRVRRGGGVSVAVGWDGRVSSPALSEALVEGIASTGVDVVTVGLGPTPMLYYAVFELDLDGGVMVTGSHNPPNYNGFKMMLGKGPCYGEAIQDLGRLAATGDLDTGAGSVRSEDIFDRYIQRLARDFTAGAFKVAWDPANGAAGPAVKALVETLPGEHIVFNNEVDGTFPNHHADPTVEANLEQLKEVVRREGCDFGFSFDGDGDRIGAIDAKGRVLWGDQMIAILAADVLKEVPGAPIIADVKASQALFDRVAELGGRPIMWKTGHSLIKAKMVEEQSPVSGEMSGHIFFKHKFYGHDDAIYAAVRLMNAIRGEGGDLAAIRDSLPQMINTPELRFDCPDEEKFAAVDRVKAYLAQKNADVNDIDGVRVLTSDGWWLLRASNTQAVLVARCEASSDAGLVRLKAELVAALSAAGIAPPDDL